MRTRPALRRALVAVLALGLAAATAPAGAHHDGPRLRGPEWDLHRTDPSAPLIAHDEHTAGIVSPGPTGKKIKNLAVAGRGERLLPDATTDVWALGPYAYIGTFNEPCGDGTGDNGSGIRIFDIRNKTRPAEVAHIGSPVGSRSNDVKVASMNSGDVLVHSNESCAGGPGGFEIYDVDDPTNPMHLASVRIDELNEISDFLFGGITDVGVHNLWLFTQGSNDYVAAVAETAFHNFMVFDITDPTSPTMVSAWGAEEIFDPGVGDLTFADAGGFSRVLSAALWLLDGFGSSRNRFLHDITISDDGMRGYLSNWDAGLVLLDLSDPANPSFVSTALDPENGSLDGEVNSHAAWPSSDGSIVVETEEDFDSSVIQMTVDTGPLAGNTYELNEMSDNDTPLSSVAPLSGEVVYVGRGCNTDAHTTGDPSIDPPGTVDPYLQDASGKIAVIRRGGCSFFSKVMTAGDNGAIAAIVADNTPGGTEPPGNFTAGDATAGIPALVMSTAGGDDFEANPVGNQATIDSAPDPWGGVRIWDYSDPANPVLKSTFNTVNSRNEAGPPDERGTYSVHNVLVEGTKAYISWYSDGMLVLDISDPANPREVGRYHRSGPAFEAMNGGIQDIWGVYKMEGQPWIYGSDRNGGLYVLKEFGKGSAKQGKG